MFKKSKIRIIVTAGPTLVPIDKVRVMTNIFGGRLGYYIADLASKKGHDTLLLMGYGNRVKFSGKEKFKLKQFKYYNEIRNLLKSEIQKKRYQVVIHSAAIPDYIPINVYNGKIKSGKKELVIHFKPTKKIIDQFKKWDSNIFVVKFKLEANEPNQSLIKIGYESLKDSKADLIVVNNLSKMKKQQLAYILDKNKKITQVEGKKQIAKKLITIIENHFNKYNAK